MPMTRKLKYMTWSSDSVPYNFTNEFDSVLRKFMRYPLQNLEIGVGGQRCSIYWVQVHALVCHNVDALYFLLIYKNFSSWCIDSIRCLRSYSQAPDSGPKWQWQFFARTTSIFRITWVAGALLEVWRIALLCIPYYFGRFSAVSCFKLELIEQKDPVIGFPTRCDELKAFKDPWYESKFYSVDSTGNFSYP